MPVRTDSPSAHIPHEAPHSSLQVQSPVRACRTVDSRRRTVHCAARPATARAVRTCPADGPASRSQSLSGTHRELFTRLFPHRGLGTRSIDDFLRLLNERSHQICLSTSNSLKPLRTSRLLPVPRLTPIFWRSTRSTNKRLSAIATQIVRACWISRAKPSGTHGTARKASLRRTRRSNTSRRSRR